MPGPSVRADLAGIALGPPGGTCFGVHTVSADLLTGRDVAMTAAVSVTLLAGGSALLPWTLAGLPALTAPVPPSWRPGSGSPPPPSRTCSSSGRGEGAAR